MLHSVQGATVSSYSYEAFGAITSQTGQDSNSYIYMGQAYDTSTGLYYMNARWYDSSIGRFITADPLPGNPFQSGSTNRYAYALDNPITFEDVSGLTPALKSTRTANPAQSDATSDENPSIWALVFIGLLLTVAILITELALIAAEAILAGIGGLFAVISGLVFVALSLFLINLEVAYWVYVYRVSQASPDEQVTLNLNPFELWGLLK